MAGAAGKNACVMTPELRPALESHAWRNRDKRAFALRFHGDMTLAESMTGSCENGVIPTVNMRQERLTELATNIIIEVAVERVIRRGGCTYQQLFEAGLLAKIPDNVKPHKILPKEEKSAAELTWQLAKMDCITTSAAVGMEAEKKRYWNERLKADKAGIACETRHPCAQLLSRLNIDGLIAIAVPSPKQWDRAGKKMSMRSGSNSKEKLDPDEEIGASLLDINRLTILPATLELSNEFFRRLAVHERDFGDSAAHEIFRSAWKVRSSGYQSQRNYVALTKDLECPVGRTFKGTIGEIICASPEQYTAYGKSHPIYVQLRKVMNAEHQPDFSRVNAEVLEDFKKFYPRITTSYAAIKPEWGGPTQPLRTYDLLSKFDALLREKQPCKEGCTDMMDEIIESAQSDGLLKTAASAKIEFADFEQLRQNATMNSLEPLTILARNEGLSRIFKELTAIHFDYHLEAVRRSSDDWKQSWAVDALLYNASLEAGNPIHMPINPEVIVQTVGKPLFHAAQSEVRERLRNAPKTEKSGLAVH